LLQRTGAMLADPTMRANYKGQRNGIPIPIRVSRFMDCVVGDKGTPVSTIIGDIRTVRANGDPGFGLVIVNN